MDKKLSGVVGPPGSAKPYKLEGKDHTLKIISVHPENGYDEKSQPIPSDHLQVIVEYPDGYQRHHQVKDKQALLGQISGQMKGRYGIPSFAFAAVPDELDAGAEIKIEG